MTTYTGRSAALYDRLYAQKDYAGEAAAAAALLREHARGPVRRVLELACGTGGHALHLAAAGLDVVATDRSTDMLALARAKAHAAGARARFVEADMCALDAADLGGPFDGVVCLFDSLGHAGPTERVLAALEGARRLLRPGGALVAEVFHAAPFLRAPEPARVRRLEGPGGVVTRVSETTVDLAAQVARVRHMYLEPAAGGALTPYVEEHTVRFFLAADAAVLLRAAGLEPGPALGGLAGGPVTSDAWHLVLVARRPDEPR